MSLEILEKVKDFLIRLVKDEVFRAQLIDQKVEDVRKVMADSGYSFSQEEFETAAIKILELKDNGEFEDLSESELVGAVGGITSIASEGFIQPLYGVIYKPPIKCLRPCTKPLPKPQPQPMYGGIVISPIEPIAQPMYGVIISTES